MGGCDRGAEKPCEGDAFSDGSAVVAGAAGILPQGGGYSARFAEDELVGCGWRCVEERRSGTLCGICDRFCGAGDALCASGDGDGAGYAV